MIFVFLSSSPDTVGLRWQGQWVLKVFCGQDDIYEFFIAVNMPGVRKVAARRSMGVILGDPAQAAEIEQANLHPTVGQRSLQAASAAAAAASGGARAAVGGAAGGAAGPGSIEPNLQLVFDKLEQFNTSMKH